MLQKPSRKSKNADHVKYLTKRLSLWRDGEILDILREGRRIQGQLAASKKKPSPDHARRVFVKLMLQGKVSSALRWLDNKCSGGAIEVNEEVLNLLKEKHPPARKSSIKDLMRGPCNRVESVLYDQIDGDTIYRAALTTKGSGGPTHVDAESWKRILCSKSFEVLLQNFVTK